MTTAAPPLGDGALDTAGAADAATALTPPKTTSSKPANATIARDCHLLALFVALSEPRFRMIVPLPLTEKLLM
jgi:hypothetical protein